MKTYQLRTPDQIQQADFAIEWTKSVMTDCDVTLAGDTIEISIKPSHFDAGNRERSDRRELNAYYFLFGALVGRTFTPIKTGTSSRRKS